MPKYTAYVPAYALSPVGSVSNEQKALGNEGKGPSAVSLEIERGSFIEEKIFELVLKNS